jgi:hypothetical protein
MKILLYIHFGNLAIYERKEDDKKEDEDREDTPLVKVHLMILVKDLILKNKDIFNHDKALRMLVKALYYNRLILISSFRVIFDMLSTNKYSIFEKSYIKNDGEQNMLLKLCLFSV